MRKESGMRRRWVNPFKSIVPHVGYYDINVLLEALRLKACSVSHHVVFNPKVRRHVRATLWHNRYISVSDGDGDKQPTKRFDKFSDSFLLDGTCAGTTRGCVPATSVLPGIRVSFSRVEPHVMTVPTDNAECVHEDAAR